MRERIQSTEITSQVEIIVKKIEAIETRFHKFREDCAVNIFNKLEMKMKKMKEDQNKEEKEQKLYDAINKVNESLEKNIILIIEKQIVMNKYYILKSRTRDHLLSKIIDDQQSVLDILSEIHAELEIELKNIENDKKILESYL